MSYRDFEPERISLDQHASDWELDQEVAAHIANYVNADKSLVYDGNGYYEPLIVVDPTGNTQTRKFASEQPVPDPDEHWSYRLGFDADESDAVNGMFATELAKSMFEEERANRMGWKGSVAMSSIIVGIPAGLTAWTIEAAPSEATAGATLAVGSVCTYVAGKPMAEHFYRINVVRPNSYLGRKKLEKAAARVEDFDLPPVVVKK